MRATLDEYFWKTKITLSLAVWTTKKLTNPTTVDKHLLVINTDSINHGHWIHNICSLRHDSQAHALCLTRCRGKAIFYSSDHTMIWSLLTRSPLEADLGLFYKYCEQRSVLSLRRSRATLNPGSRKAKTGKRKWNPETKPGIRKPKLESGILIPEYGINKSKKTSSFARKK